MDDLHFGLRNGGFIMETKISVKNKDYAYPTLPDLKKHTAKVLRDFHPRKGDPLCIDTKEQYFENLFRIRVKKIYKWKKCSDQEDRRPALKDVLFLSILVSPTRQEARYYMAVAGYPFVEYPRNHKNYDQVLTSCFAVIDAVYAKYEVTSEQTVSGLGEVVESNTLRKKRLDEAHRLIFELDEGLANEWIPAE